MCASRHPRRCGRRISSSTRRPGPTWTAPRTTPRVPPSVAYSTDYVFDGRKGAPYLESDSPSPQSAYGMTKLHGEAAAGDRAWVIRSSWLFGPTGHNFVHTMLRLGAERDEVAVGAAQRGCPTYVGHLATATRELVDAAQPVGLWHVAAGGDCTWAD